MLKKLLLVLLLFTVVKGLSQSCPTPLLTNPQDGDINVPVNTQISWNSVTGVPGYILSIGLTPFGGEILSNQTVGTNTTYIPPLGLPADTDIYVTVTLFFFQQANIVCSTQMFHTATVTAAPPCTNLRSPMNGAVNVNVASTISWNYAPTATSYQLEAGTSPGAGDIIPSMNVGNVLSYNPPLDFPPNTDIYVTITPSNALGPAPSCTPQIFTTGDVAALPGCTQLTIPADGEPNVELSPRLEWTAVPGAIGYRVTIGLSPFTAEILNNTNFTDTETDFIEFEPNRTFFVRIVPYNDAGSATGCIQTTFSTQLGCGPFFDPNTGDLVTLNPIISFPDTLSFCENEGSLTVTSPDMADGYRWYQVDALGNETFLGDGASIELNDYGMYRYEAYNTVPQTGGTVECPSTKLFELVPSELANIISLDVSGQSGILRIEARVSGSGDYEFALDSINGPFQDSPVFENVPSGNHTVYVRDKNGCGIVSQSLDKEVLLDGFPRFFTPNGDGVNDFWQYVPPATIAEIPLTSIQIYNRFGQLLASIDPNSQGWDGTFNGKPLPSDDYWFRIVLEDGRTIINHFTLKR